MPKLMLFLHIFSTFFLMTFFLLAKLFSHISCKNPLKRINIYHILHLPYPPPPKYFSLPAWWENIREFPTMGKNQNYWGDGGQISGGCIPPSPGICSPALYLYIHTPSIFTRTLYFSTHSPFLFLSTYSLSLSLHTHTHTHTVSLSLDYISGSLAIAVGIFVFFAYNVNLTL